MAEPSNDVVLPTRSGQIVIIGAGPGGLTAAYQLCKRGAHAVVLEKDSEVGGISRTVHHNGYHFDIGGHRFFTKVKAVDDFWHEVMDDGEFVLRSRMSRIHYNRRFFHYPLRAANAFFGLGPIASVSVLASYLWIQLFPIKDERSFADWVTNRFGRRLYETFFKTYTEKVWGIPCTELSADWAAQRIKGLSLMSAVRNALWPKRASTKADVIKTLIDAFHYPRLGPGQMWETVANTIQKQGAELHMNADVQRIQRDGNRIVAIETTVDGEPCKITGEHFISTMPLRELIAKIDPQPPANVVAAAASLNYRDFLTVALIVNQADLFPDNWIYIHDSDVKVGRIQNFKNWSPDMVPDQSKSCIGLEYFCFEGDGLWTSSDADLVALAIREMDMIDLVRPEDVEDGAVVRMPKAYPVYDGEYKAALAVVRGFVDSVSNLHPIGRNGMHKYNNQDHSMLTAMLTVDNIYGANHDIWEVNAEDSYHEEVTELDEKRDRGPGPSAQLHDLATTQPRVPTPLTRPRT